MKPDTSVQPSDWNVLTDKWLWVMDTEARPMFCSPIEALREANKIRCIALASPLDNFSSHRFLMTLLYWKADAVGGLEPARKSLLRGRFPLGLLSAIRAESARFRMFDVRAPFLQDVSVLDGSHRSSSGASLFAEFASGTNIAHFHHGDDRQMRLCVRCATLGMLRLVPWSQSGGRGLTPSVHGAPPVMALAVGANLAITLGLNLVPLDSEAGTPRWTGQFHPSAKDDKIPYLEAFTWNPRRVHLLLPRDSAVCWGCGRRGVDAVGPIVYLKNEATRKGLTKGPFVWQDPSAFYGSAEPYTTVKSTREQSAASDTDLLRLADVEATPKAAVVLLNPGHDCWRLTIPCTNPANNKSFDHREVVLTDLSPESVRAAVPAYSRETEPDGVDGWVEPLRTARIRGAAQFVRTASVVLTHADWAVLSTAAYQSMCDSPAAFDILTGLYWSLRGKVLGVPSRNVAWLMLKLMSSVPTSARTSHVAPPLQPAS